MYIAIILAMCVHNNVATHVSVNHITALEALRQEFIMYVVYIASVHCMICVSM